jgi:hypothetical protein
VKSVPSADKSILDFVELLYVGGYFLWERHHPNTDTSLLVLRIALEILRETNYPSLHGHLGTDILAMLSISHIESVQSNTKKS